MKYIDVRFCSHIFAVLLALAYAWASDGSGEGSTITYTLFGTKHLISGYWGEFTTYMILWLFIGGVMEFIVDMFRPLVKYLRD